MSIYKDEYSTLESFRDAGDKAAYAAGIRYDDDGQTYSVIRDPSLLDISIRESLANKYKNGVKKMKESISFAPTWADAVTVYIAVLENPKADPEAKQAARDDLKRLAAIVDRQNDEAVTELAAGGDYKS
jgi:hypothetical protein